MYENGEVIYIKATVTQGEATQGNMIRCITASDGTVLWVAPSDIVKCEGK